MAKKKTKETKKVGEKTKLTVKQEKFAQEVVKTGNQAEAYRKAYNATRMKPNSVIVAASKLMLNPNVRLRVNQLRMEAEKEAKIDIAWCVEMLKSIVLDNAQDRTTAIDKLMKHFGGYDKDNRQKVVEDKIDLSKLSDKEVETYIKLQIKARVASL